MSLIGWARRNETSSTLLPLNTSRCCIHALKQACSTLLDTRGEAGDTRGEAGDTRGEAGDTRGEAGDTRGEAGQPFCMGAFKLQRPFSTRARTCVKAPGEA
jgi:hypothetical protein